MPLDSGWPPRTKHPRIEGMVIGKHRAHHLAQETGCESRTFEREKLARALADPNGARFQGNRDRARRRNGRRNGGYVERYADTDDALAYVDLLAVDRRFQARGYGREMLRGMLRHLQALGARYVYLDCLVENDNANALYQS